MIDCKVLEQLASIGARAAPVAGRRRMAQTGKRRAKVHVRLSLPNGGGLDESDIALIETLQKSRSLAQASSSTCPTGWLMADTLNRIFETKVIETFPGRKGGGAEVTAFGQRIAALFRSTERGSSRAGAAALDELTASLDRSFDAREAAEAQEDHQR